MIASIISANEITITIIKQQIVNIIIKASNNKFRFIFFFIFLFFVCHAVQCNATHKSEKTSVCTVGFKFFA